MWALSSTLALASLWLRATTASADLEPTPSFADGVCDNAQVASMSFCNPSLSLDDRVADLVSRVPLDQAIGLLIDGAQAAPSANLPHYMWWSEALHGVGKSKGVSFRSSTPVATSFPQVVATSSSFNRSLFFEVADVISTEARAFYNAHNSGLTFWTPNVNIFRDPRWGRGQETPGEDPFLTGEYAVAFVRGLQGEAMEGSEPHPKTDPKFLKISGCCKHFSAYSQEVPRHRNDAIVTKQDQADTYFPAFEDCVKRGHVSSIMCSYNAVNGIPACADKGLLTDLVRGQWKFDGYITSDCEAVADVIYHHHYTQSPERTCATTLSAGMDLNCGDFLRAHLPKALEQGIVTKDMMHAALKNLFRVQMRLGMFEKGSQPFANITAAMVDTPAHRQLALEAARQSVVLLENKDKTLPLDGGAFTNGDSLALIGPHFNASDELLGNYFGVPSHIVTPLEAISKMASSVTYALGCKVSGEPLPDLDEAVEVATKAKRVAVFVGLDQTQEREELDRYHLKLPGFQTALLARVLAVAKQPIVLVVISGGSVDLSVYKNHPKVGAIIFSGYSGQAGGQALADVLFGAYNPSGRLTQTFYDAEYADTVSIYDMHMRPTLETGNPGRTYRFFTGNPVYEFGFGLSYSDFTLDWTSEPPQELNAAAVEGLLSNKQESDSNSCVAKFSVSVANGGEMSGEHSVLCYAEPPHAGVDGRPLKTLVAFERSPLLETSQTTELQFCLPAKAFANADASGEWVVEDGEWTLHVGDLTHKVEVKKVSTSQVSREPVPLEVVEEQPGVFGLQG